MQDFPETLTNKKSFNNILYAAILFSGDLLDLKVIYSYGKFQTYAHLSKLKIFFRKL